MKNIILIGMPGAGKSTVGVLLAKSVLMNFCDTDLLIQNSTGQSLCDILKNRGLEEFIKLEEKTVLNFDFENCVVATGGSVVYGEKAMEKLKENGITVYLKVNPVELNRRINNIHTRGIAMKDGTTLEELYRERAPLYEKYADFIVDCDGVSPEECVERILRKLYKEWGK